MAKRRRRPPKPISWQRRLRFWQRRWFKASLLLKLVLVLSPFLLIYTGLWLGFVRPQYYFPPIQCSNAPVAVSLRYPHYIAVGDEGFVEVGLHNTGSQPISGTAVIAFDGPVTVHPVLAQSNTLPFKNLPPAGITTDRVRFTLNEPFTRLGGTIPVAVQITGPTTSCYLALPDSPLHVAPVPFLNSVLQTTILSGAIIPLAGLLWQRLQKRLFPEAQ